jgi:hypothetical protein
VESQNIGQLLDFHPDRAKEYYRLQFGEESLRSLALRLTISRPLATRNTYRRRTCSFGTTFRWRKTASDTR